MQLSKTENGFVVSIGDSVLLRHSDAAPCVFVGRGAPRIESFFGHFEIEDYVVERAPLRCAVIDGDEIAFSACAGAPVRLTASVKGGQIRFQSHDDEINRFWLRVLADPGEHVWGGGEQMSYFDLRGRHFPLWTSEPGVGRDKTTRITFEADRTRRAGGDYFQTYYPQPTYLSSARYALHVDTTAYAAFDFRNDTFHEIEIWESPAAIEVFQAESLAALVSRLSDRFGRQPPLPDWVYQGAIIGLKDGERSFERLEAIEAAGVKASALWCEDWVGLRHTSFGARLFWDWKASEARYPDLKTKIAELRERGVRFLGYVNCYLCTDGELFPKAEAAGYFATDASGGAALVDFGEFDCGVVDFTNPDAAAWFAEEVLGQEMLDLGMSGWMADFGEYLPIDVLLHQGDARLLHNAWPALWAEVNARAVAGRGQTGDALFFMRAGYTGVQAHCPLLWAGDQSVDFSRHDGLGTVICAALSSGLLGNAYHHSDIGGYTSLFGNVRSAELMMRWAEMAAFTPVMRTHEGNRPTENLQIDQDPDVLAHFARMTQIYVALAPYLKSIVADAVETGLPAQRPLFLHHEADAATYAIQDAYLYGRDLLVAPIVDAGAQTRSQYLPKGVSWVHLWSGDVFEGGAVATAPAPFGEPAVFFREDSVFAPLFVSLRSL